MASFPHNQTHAEGEAAATESSVGFALQELIACWSQAHEAMTRGDLQTVTALLNQADEHLRTAGDGSADSAAEATQRQRAATAYNLLQHAMETGLTSLRKEIGHARRGKKALNGYSKAAGTTSSRLLKSC